MGGLWWYLNLVPQGTVRVPVSCFIVVCIDLHHTKYLALGGHLEGAGALLPSNAPPPAFVRPCVNRTAGICIL